MSFAEMSFSGAVMVTAIIVVRALTLHRLPKRTFSALWDAALLRLLVPYALPCTLSVYTLAGRLAPAAGTAEAAPNPAVPAVPDLPPAPLETVSHGTAALDLPPAVPAADLWEVVWLAGALLCGAFFAAAYWKCRREFRTALPVENGFAEEWLRNHRLRRPVALRQSDKISAPLTYGVLRPVILLPKTAPWEDREAMGYMLEHEYAHIRRFDAAVKLALAAALSVHWCNPAVWAMYVLANRDMELACDEAVLRRLGEDGKTAYAMTLIRMEETKSGLMPLCGSFSKNGTEERIVAIMKIKKTSLTAAFAALTLVAGVTTAFATSAQMPPAAPDRSPEAETLYEVRHITSYVDRYDGQTWYSDDDGMTWTAGEPFQDRYGDTDIDWWTAEEYEAQLEEIREEYQSMLGERSWTPSTGWFTWTQEKIDEAIEGNEQLLEDIKNGKKVSKPAVVGDGEMIQYSYDPRAVQASAETSADEQVQAVQIGDVRNYGEELLKAYSAFGLTYDEAENVMYFNGRPVRYFLDGVDIGDGTASVYEFLNEDGVVDVHTLREAVMNADGSADPLGRLTGIEADSQEAFDSRDISALKNTGEQVVYAFAAGGDSGEDSGETFGERFARYRDFGITYAEAEGVSGAGNVYWNGRPVCRFSDVDPDGGAFSFTSDWQGGLCVRTVYDGDGTLQGVEAVPCGGRGLHCRNGRQCPWRV